VWRLAVQIDLLDGSHTMWQFWQNSDVAFGDTRSGVRWYAWILRLVGLSQRQADTVAARHFMFVMLGLKD